MSARGPQEKPYERGTPMFMRYTPMRCTPVREAHERGTLIRCTL
jgi:hypothetical protein